MQKIYKYAIAILVLLSAGGLLLSYLMKDKENVKNTTASTLKIKQFSDSNRAATAAGESNSDVETTRVAKAKDSAMNNPANIALASSDLPAESVVTPDVDVASYNLPEKLLKPAAETKISRVPRARLTSDNLEILDFINSRRIQNSLDILDTLPTRLNTEEVLKLTNAKRVADGLEPLSEMPTGMPAVDEK